MVKKKIIQNTFSIHPLTYVLIIISLLTARFKNLIIFMSLIIFHELGHLLTAKIFNWNIDKIYIYPLGGLTKFNEKINKPFIEELLITIMGPVFQIIITFIFINNSECLLYSKLLLLFNLLPIIPLDGGRLLGILLSRFTPYKTSLIITVRISILMYFIVLIYNIINIKSIFFIIIIFLLIFKILEEKKKINYYFNKFILERHLFKFRFKKNIIINNINDMYKYRNNNLKKNNCLLSEDNFFNYID